jgi:hypothetical protein
MKAIDEKLTSFLTYAAVPQAIATAVWVTVERGDYECAKALLYARIANASGNDIPNGASGLAFAFE